MCPLRNGSQEAVQHLWFVFCIVFTVCITARPLYAQWHQVNGPPGGIVECLVVDSVGPGDTRIFAGTYTAGIFQSTDGGGTWTASNTGLGNMSVMALAVGPGGGPLYAGTNGGGIYRSTDHGVTWAEADSGIRGGSGNNLYVESISSFAAATSDTIVLTGTYGGIFRSTNKGTSWSQTDSGYTYGWQEIDAILSVPDGSGGTIVLAGNRNNFAYLSTDEGISWIQSKSGLNSNNVFCLTNVGSTIFAGTYNGVYSIGIHDASWTQVSTGLPTQYTNWIYSIIAAPDGLGGTNLVVGSTTGGYISTDLGGHWSPLSNGLANMMVTSLASVGTTLVAGTYGAGIYRMSSSGSSWTESSNGLLASSIQSIASVSPPAGGTDMYVGVEGNGLFHSTDGGGTWTHTFLTPPGDYAHVGVYAVASGQDSAGRQILYAGTGNGMYRSTDNGTTWGLGAGTAYLTVGSIAVRGTMVFAAPSLISTNAGGSWSSFYGWGKASVAILPSGPGAVYLFAAPPPNGVLASADTGKTWNSVSDNWHNLNPLPGQWWNANVLAVNGTTLLAGTESGVFVTADLGQNWNTVNAGLVDSAVHAFSTGTSVFAGANDGGVYLLTNFGTRWQSVNPGLPDAEIDALAEYGPYLYAGTQGRGLWRRPMSEIVSGVADNGVPAMPKGYSLEQNYPNPFNPTTDVRFEVPSVSDVRIVVFDVLGREIATLVDGARLPGSYVVRWDASKSASGTYFIRMQAGTFTQVRKVLLIR